MPRLFTSVALLSYFLSAQKAVFASPCVAFDINWNLLAFGLNGKDYNAGTNDTWTTGTATEITASGRPPFDGTGTTCYLDEFDNAIYVMNGDTANPTSIYMYDATAKSWTTQATTPPSSSSFSMSSLVAILDHDTNIFYGVSNDELFSLEMGSPAKAASSSAITWTDVQNFPVTGYNSPVAALANNHVHFLNVPNVAAGSAEIFVIHFSWFQPTTQSYGNFPASHGQTASIFLNTGVQQEFLFVPDDNSATYVINVISNTTQTLAAPPTQDSAATYFGAPNTLVQMTSNGAVSFLPYSAGQNSVNSAAKWSTVSSLASFASSNSSSSSSGSSASGSATKASGSATHSASGSAASSSSSGSSSSSNGANEMVRMSGGLMIMVALVMGAVGFGSAL